MMSSMWATGEWGIGRRPRDPEWGVSPAAEEKLKRIRLLNADLEVLRSAAVERTRQAETKASFIVVAAGVLASATGVGLITIDTWLIGVVPFGLTVATVALATVALWPRKLDVASARNLVDNWVESEKSAADLEDYLLEVKAVEIARRDAQNEQRVKWSKRAFAYLLASLVAALLVAGTNALAPIWSENAEQQRVEAPTSPEATVAP
ncbi:hypothetical protein ACU6RU_14170 [Microbacterium sp. F1-18]